MQRNIVRLMLAVALTALPVVLQAQPTAHYVPGVEGIKAASLPPPGWYVRDYNVGYYANQLNGSRGSDLNVPGLEVGIYANVPRVIWITETKVLGGYLGFDALVPLTYKSISAGGAGSDSFGVGDLFAEATLSWHTKQFDFSFGAGSWMPTGDAPPPAVVAGNGYWTPMLTAGATWYMDAEKTWAISALNRYEFNIEHDDMVLTPGQAYTLEWGLSKTLNKTIDVGVVGYYQQQVTQDSAQDVRDRVAAVGPEISVAFPKPMLFVSLRYLYEFMAEDRLQGHTFGLTLTKRF